MFHDQVGRDRAFQLLEFLERPLHLRGPIPGAIRKAIHSVLFLPGPPASQIWITWKPLFQHSPDPRPYIHDSLRGDPDGVVVNMGIGVFSFKGYREGQDKLFLSSQGPEGPDLTRFPIGAVTLEHMLWEDVMELAEHPKPTSTPRGPLPGTGVPEGHGYTLMMRGLYPGGSGGCSVGQGQRSHSSNPGTSPLSSFRMKGVTRTVASELI